MVFQILKPLESIYLYMFFKRCADYFTILHEPEFLLRVPPSAPRSQPRQVGTTAGRRVVIISPGRDAGGAPPAALACDRDGMSKASMRSGTSVSAAYRGGGGVQSAFSSINSTVFSRCRDSLSYLKRMHSSASPYFSVSFLVPGCPGFKISRVLTRFSSAR